MGSTAAQPGAFVLAPDSRALLDGGLTPRARLLYATLIAARSADGVGPAECQTLAGLTDPTAARQAMDELVAEGLVVRTDPADGTGETEPAAPAGPTVRVRGTALHECRACRDCGECACPSWNTMRCWSCWRAKCVRDEARADIARWRRQREAGATYAYGRSGSRLHRWDCPTLLTVEDNLATMEESLTRPHGQGYWRRLPQLYTAEELRRKTKVRRFCLTCAPEPDPVREGTRQPPS
ncbi:hypothetical protein ACIA8O_16930 [Kitasatospora sp. NPDC051853]|uniref:hypothetical protein n=1 Tax=Kitasatospora sp. NPDC051853 TaxID=3364058 RepID=UPI0037AB8B8F